MRLPDKLSVRFALSLILGLCLNASVNGQSCCAPATEFASFGADPLFVRSHEVPENRVPGQRRGEFIELQPSDGVSSQAYLIRSEQAGNNWLFVFHEWWGLNEHIKAEAESLAGELPGLNVLCLDLYDGQVAGTREEASRLMQEVNEVRVRAIINAAKYYVTPRANIASIGWCFGGTWSMQSALQLGKLNVGLVLYYGMPEMEYAKLKRLDAPVLGIFARHDQWITTELVEQFSEKMQFLEKDHEILIFEAEHAFANPSKPHYDRKAKKIADRAAIEFLNTCFAD